MHTGEITVDTRGSTILWFRVQNHDTYLGTEDDSGIITLIPSARVPAKRENHPVPYRETETR